MSNAGSLGVAGTSASSFKIERNEYYATTTYTPSAGVKYFMVECVAGGGGGGGTGEAPTAGQFCVGGSGGGGEYTNKLLVPSDIPSYPAILTVGAGGFSGPSGGTAGGNGGASSLDSVVISAGGTGGAGQSAEISLQVTLGGEGGTGGAGSIQIDGGRGGDSLCAAGGFSGAGGSSYYGSSLPARPFIGATENHDGRNAQEYGSGGQGAMTSDIGQAKTGGAGSAGIVIITEYS